MGRRGRASLSREGAAAYLFRVKPFPVRWMAPAALALAILSLALNVLLLRELRDPGRLIGPLLDRSLARMVERDVRVAVEVRVPMGTPVHLDIPIDQRYDVKVNASLPINTTIQLPVSTPFGTRSFEVPVRANVPIRTELPVHLRDTFRLRTETRSEIVLPIEIPLRDLPLDELRRSLDP